jgi:hypothetical protein
MAGSSLVTRTLAPFLDGLTRAASDLSELIEISRLHGNMSTGPVVDVSP